MGVRHSESLKGNPYNKRVGPQGGDRHLTEDTKMSGKSKEVYNFLVFFPLTNVLKNASYPGELTGERDEYITEF